MSGRRLGWITLSDPNDHIMSPYAERKEKMVRFGEVKLYVFDEDKIEVTAMERGRLGTAIHDPPELETLLWVDRNGMGEDGTQYEESGRIWNNVAVQAVAEEENHWNEYNYMEKLKKQLVTRGVGSYFVTIADGGRELAIVYLGEEEEKGKLGFGTGMWRFRYWNAMEGSNGDITEIYQEIVQLEEQQRPYYAEIAKQKLRNVYYQPTSERAKINELQKKIDAFLVRVDELLNWVTFQAALKDGALVGPDHLTARLGLQLCPNYGQLQDVPQIIEQLQDVPQIIEDSDIAELKEADFAE